LRCKGCALLFCSAHFHRATHSCIAAATDTATAVAVAVGDVATNSAGAAKSASASVKSIFESIERRHDSLFAGAAGMEKTHGGGVSTISTAGTAAAAGDIAFIASMAKLQHIASSGSDRQARIATRTRDLLLRGKATAMHKDTAVEDRLHLIVTFAADEAKARKCVFVNARTTTVGDLCEWVAKTMSMLAFKKVMRPDGQSVYFAASAKVTEEEESLPHAEFDRRMLAAAVLAPMQELRFHAVSSAAAAAAQEVLAAQSDAVAAEAEEKEKQAAAAAEAEKAAAVAASKVIDPTKLAIGDLVLYNKGDLVQVATIKLIHLDDYPNLYFTISVEAAGGVTEKQTTAKHLQPLLAEEISPQAGGFSLTVTHGGKNIRINGVGALMSVSLLKALIQRHTDISPKNQKLICKGVILKDAELLRDTKITPGCKISLMGTKK